MQKSAISDPPQGTWTFLEQAGNMFNDVPTLPPVDDPSRGAVRTDAESQACGSSAAAPIAPPRPRCVGLPLHCAFAVLDCVSVRDIGLSAARVSRVWYKTAAVQYADRIRVIACKPEAEAEGTETSASASSSSASPLPPIVRCAVSPRSDVFLPRSQSSLSAMLNSRLRWLLFGIRTQLHVDVSTVAKLAERCPQLHSCEFVLRSDSLTPTIVFPPYLRSLTLALLFFEEDQFSGRRVRGWTTGQIDSYVVRVITAVAGLRCLREFGVRLSDMLRLYMAKPKWQWLAPLANPPAGCRGVQCIRAEMLTLDEPLSKCLASIRSLTQIKVSPERAFGGIIALLSGAEASQVRLKSVPTLASSIVGQDLVPYLLKLRGSLEDLSPRYWSVPALDFLLEFRALRTVRFVEFVPLDESDGSYYPASPPKSALSTIRNLSAESVVCALELMPLLTDVSVGFRQLSNGQMDRILAALTRLERFQVDSEAVTSLACFSSHPHLAVTLTELSIKLPNVDREHTTHLLALANLTSLNIEGSFSEPLYAQMLLPFTTRYRGAPLHWLRKFVPRSPKEAVPSRPLDASEKQAAYESFDRRVRAGLVCAAELLNSFQLTGIMQFLGIREFSLASRTCRAWRAAGSLPSSWPEARYTGVGEIVPTALGAALGPDDPDAMPALHPSRFLKLPSNAPQASRTILPELPLWKAARCIELVIASPFYYTYQTVSVAEHAKLTPALEALACMKRLESLSADFSHHYESPALLPFFAAIGGQLRRGQFSSLPLAHLRTFVRMEELSLAWGPGPGASNTGPGLELQALVSLRCLSLTGVTINDALAAAVCFLSTRHCLRSLEVNFCGSIGISHFQPNNHHHAVRDPKEFIPRFVQALAEPASGGPAMLDSLRIFHSLNLSQLSLQPLPMLPRLRTLDVTAILPLSVNLADLELAGMQGANLSTLESLSLGVTVSNASFGTLALLTGLRALRLTDTSTGEDSDHRDFSIQLPVGVLARWCRSMVRLEVLALDGVQAPSGEGELSSLAQLKALRALSLCKQHWLRTSDLAVLPQIQRLQELQLHCIAHVELQQRTWLDKFYASSASLAAAPSDLLSYLRGCTSLRLLRWSPSEVVMRANEDYSGRRPGIRNRGRLSQIDRDQLCFMERARDREALRSIIRQRAEAQRAWLASMQQQSELSLEPAPSAPPDSLRVQCRFGNPNSHYRYSWLQMATNEAVATSAKSVARLKDEGFSPHINVDDLLSAAELAAADAALLEAECEEERAAAALVGLAAGIN